MILYILFILWLVPISLIVISRWLSARINNCMLAEAWNIEPWRTDIIPLFMLILFPISNICGAIFSIALTIDNYQDFKEIKRYKQEIENFLKERDLGI